MRTGWRYAPKGSSTPTIYSHQIRIKQNFKRMLHLPLPMAKRSEKQKQELTEQQATALLKKYAPNSRVFQLVLQHGKAVQKAAVVIGNAIAQNKRKVDVPFLKSAALLHDIGRFACPPGTKGSVCHGFIGAQWLRKEGYPKHALVCERHVGSGITKKEIIAQKTGLPKKDFFPRTIEEKIICYADKLIFQDRLAQPDEAVKNFKKDVPSYDALLRLIALHNEIEKAKGGENFYGR